MITQTRGQTRTGSRTSRRRPLQNNIRALKRAFRQTCVRACALGQSNVATDRTFAIAIACAFACFATSSEQNSTNLSISPCKFPQTARIGARSTDSASEET
eukprot:1391387-Pleurochrysis_carterae.AAC.1